MLTFMQNILVRYSNLLVYPIVAAALALFFTYICLFLMPRLGFMDIPRGRHAHKAPTPRGGGIAIVLAFVAASGLFLLNTVENTVFPPFSSSQILGFCIPA